jgi:inner membrane protein
VRPGPPSHCPDSTFFYAILYVLLKAEDYSLLCGSLLLFGLLASVMIATRRIDWYALRAQAGAPRS